MTPLPRTVDGYCYPCHTARVLRFAGYATDGREATERRPRAAHYTCPRCGHAVLALGNVSDAEGLCRLIAHKKIAADGRGVEIDDAVAHLYWQIWKLYLSWKPDRLSFLSYASHWLPRKLATFIYQATGDAALNADGERRKGLRGTPLAHAVSVSYDALLESDDPPLALAGRSGTGGLDEALSGDTSHADDDMQGDLGWLLGCGDSRAA